MKEVQKDQPVEAPATAGKASAKARPPKLTRGQLFSQHAVQGGKCYVSGEPLGEDFVVAGGKLICKAVDEIRGSRDLEALRRKIADELDAAHATVKRFDKLRTVDLGGKPGRVVFEGERQKQPATTAGAAGRGGNPRG